MDAAKRKAIAPLIPSSKSKMCHEHPNKPRSNAHELFFAKFGRYPAPFQPNRQPSEPFPQSCKREPELRLEDIKLDGYK